jgi:hypothetical protein
MFWTGTVRHGRTRQGKARHSRGSSLAHDLIFQSLACELSSGNDQNGGTRAHLLPALTLAQRALCAAAILLRPAAEIVVFFRVDFPARR